MREMLFKLQDPGPLLPPVIYFLVPCLLVLVSFLFIATHNGAHPEIDQYVPHYLSRQSLAAKIFAFDKVEAPPVYRPRPLSYMVDNYDVAFIGWSARIGHPHLLSVSYFCFKIMTCLGLFYLLRSVFGLPRSIAFLLVCLILTTPSMSIGGGFFRSAKPGSLFFLLLTFLLLCGLYQAARSKRARNEQILRGFIAGFTLLVACLFDEVAVALSFAAFIVLGTACVLTKNASRKNAAARCLVVTAVVIAVFAFYNFSVQPRLILAVTGKAADMQYQHGAAGALFHRFPLHALGAPWVFLDACGFVFGSFPPVAMAFVIAGLIFIWVNNPGRDADSPSNYRLILIATGLVMLLGCLFGMISRHSPIMNLSVRRAAYVEPFELAFLVFTGASLAELFSRGAIAPRFAEIGLWGLLLSNIVCLPPNLKLLSGDVASSSNLPVSVLEALRSGTSTYSAETKQALLKSPLYRALYEEMRLGGTARE